MELDIITRERIMTAHNSSIDYYHGFIRDRSRPELLDEAIKEAEKAYALAPVHYEHLKNIIHGLVVLYVARFPLTSDRNDLVRSYEYAERLVASSSIQETSYVGYLQVLGAASNECGKHLGSETYLQRSIEVLEHAADLISKGRLSIPQVYGSLGLSYVELYKFTTSLHYLHAGIQAFKQHLKLVNPGTDDYSGAYNNLAIGYRNLFERTNDPEDLKEAILAYRKALEYVDTHSIYYLVRLINLANGLVMLFSKNHQIEDLNEAIGLYETAIEGTPPGNPFLMMRLNGLATALRLRFNHANNDSDLHRAIDLGEKIMNNTDPESTSYPGFLQSHAANLSALDDIFPAIGRADKISQAMEKATRLSLKGELASGVGIAMRWVEWAFYKKRWSEVVSAYGFARTAVERVLKSQSGRTDKETWLKDLQGGAVKVAYSIACLEDAGAYNLALQYLEEGLGRLLREALAVNQFELERLRVMGHGKLLDRFYEVSRRINYAQAQEQSLTVRADTVELEEIVETIRELEGLGKFMLPLKADDIMQLAGNEPLVYIFATLHGGMALIVEGQTNVIKPILLPEFSQLELSLLIKEYCNIIEANDLTGKERISSGQPRNIAFQEENESVNQVSFLQSLWTNAMHPIARQLIGQSSITLIPVGMVSYLPLHAAMWKHDTGESPGYFLDNFDVKYAPNAMSLSTPGSTNNNGNGLIVDEPENTLSRLPGAHFEALAISEFFKSSKVLRGNKATNKAVIEQFKYDFSAYHFSCHGASVVESPLKSYLALAGNDRLTVLDMLTEQLPGRLVTLSACRTNVIGLNLPEESVSLSASLLQAGASAVIGSLWLVDDFTTMTIMVRFYDLWQRDNMPSSAAFNLAIRWLRDARAYEISTYLKKIFKQLQSSPTYTPDYELIEQFNHWIFKLEKDGDKQIYKDDMRLWAGFTYSGK
jgi:CHAT domain-containing protein